jgi:hypothetical protein
MAMAHVLADLAANAAYSTLVAAFILVAVGRPWEAKKPFSRMRSALVTTARRHLRA